jgi:hypothetical protein
MGSSYGTLQEHYRSEHEKANISMTDRRAALVWGDPESDSVRWTFCRERREGSASLTLLSPPNSHQKCTPLDAVRVMCIYVYCYVRCTCCVLFWWGISWQSRENFIVYSLFIF